MNESLPHYNLHIVGPNGEPSSVEMRRGHDNMDRSMQKKFMKLAMQKMKRPLKTRMKKTKAPKYY